MLEGQMRLGRAGDLISAQVATNDDHLRVEFAPSESNIAVSVRGRTFTMPVGPAMEVMDIQGNGVLSQGELRINSLEYFLYGGQGTASMTLRWQGGWTLESNFDFKRVGLEAAMRALKIQMVSDGTLDSTGIIRMQAAKFESLFERPQIDATFLAHRGNLAGFDIPRALQQRFREGVQGGKTLFEELSGSLSSRDGRYQYRAMKLSAGVLKAGGQVDISPEGNVSGRIAAELRASAGTVRGNFNVSGNDQATILKP
jgi:uncharacterized protein involved in outer membrane biogenesis